MFQNSNQMFQMRMLGETLLTHSVYLIRQFVVNCYTYMHACIAYGTGWSRSLRIDSNITSSFVFFGRVQLVPWVLLVALVLAVDPVDLDRMDHRDPKDHQ